VIRPPLVFPDVAYTVFATSLAKFELFFLQICQWVVLFFDRHLFKFQIFQIILSLLQTIIYILFVEK
jgi:hypothetical protein